MRDCASCGRDLPRTSFTTNQWTKGQGISRCAACVHGHRSDTPSTSNVDGGRHNLSTRATVPTDELDYPFAQGAFRYVAQGQYTEGSRKGQPCVFKWFKSGVVFEADYFTLDIKAADKALELVNRFNEAGIVGKPIQINVPAVWTMERSRQKILVEPFIENYEKFNSNTGWYNEDSAGWCEAMQALSHFSYHITGGFYVLCDLQGGIYRHSVVLSDPVILSRRSEYGVTDLGPDGISSFFYQHECNVYCRPQWTKPANPVQHYRPTPGTSMIRRTVPTVHGAPAGTFAGIMEEDEEDDYYY